MGYFGQQHADCYIDGCCTLFLTAWRMMLSCWHSAAVLCLHCFPHISPLVWVISARKCPMMTAKALFFPNPFSTPSAPRPHPRSASTQTLVPVCWPPASVPLWLPKASCFCLSAFPVAQLLRSFWLLVLLAKSHVSSHAAPSPVQPAASEKAFRVPDRSSWN